jgi:hypothetical protein
MENPIQLPFEIKYKRIYNLIPVPFIIGLITLFVYFIFIKREDADGIEFPVIFFLIFGFVSLVGGFLIYQFIKQFLKPQPILRLDEAGMEYNLGGVGTGMIHWNEIREVKEMEINVTQSGRPGKETVIGIILKDPENYRAKKNKFLGKLMQVSDNMYETSLFITPSALGRDYMNVKNKMQEMVTLANRRGPA